MERLKFEAISGVYGSPTTNPLTLHLKSSDPKKIKEIKKLLTVRNKSAAWQVRKAKEQLVYWEAFDQSVMAPEVADKVKAKITAARTILTENAPLCVQEFYSEFEGGLEVPAGFWWLPESIESNCHHSTLLNPAFITGLRDYQIECLTEMYKYNRATGMLATGLGKSLIIASICVATVNAGRRACVVVPTEYLVGQMLETISKYVINVKAYGGKHKSLPLGSDILVVTAASAGKFIGPYHTIVIDESHHSPASTWVELLTSAENATHVYNLTATAFRSDGMDLAIHAFGGPVVYERDTRWGIANGWLKPLKAYVATLPAKRPDGSVITLGDKIPSTRAYSILTKNVHVLEFAKNMLKKALAGGRRTIVLFKTVAAGEAFRDVCKRDGIKFDVASSKYTKPLADFRDNLSQVLVSNDRLVSEGIDIKSADCLILLTNHSSDVITYQAIGRVLRPSPGRENALVIDITVAGYAQYDRAQNARSAVFAEITDDISLVGKKS